ncbi:MAG: helix-turn-helix domain-containing protein [Oscillospiraceae bacterium]
MDFGTRLKELRSQKGVSQEKLASDIHISRSAVAKWENGLGLPGEDSLTLLADYFGISANELLPERSCSQQPVQNTKNTLKRKKALFVLSGLAGIALLAVIFCFCKPLREYATPAALGIMIIILGIFNIKGNIASIHWYNRRKVTKENQLPYCRLMGLGSILSGLGLIVYSVLKAFLASSLSEYILMALLISGLGLMIFAQLKYNRGIF